MKHLPDYIKDKIAGMPEYSYGVNKITVELEDGSTYREVYVGWAEEIIKVGDKKTVPFDPSKVVEVFNEP